MVIFRMPVMDTLVTSTSPLKIHWLSEGREWFLILSCSHIRIFYFVLKTYLMTPSKLRCIDLVPLMNILSFCCLSLLRVFSNEISAGIQSILSKAVWKIQCIRNHDIIKISNNYANYFRWSCPQFLFHSEWKWHTSFNILGIFFFWYTYFQPSRFNRKNKKNTV